MISSIYPLIVIVTAKATNTGLGCPLPPSINNILLMNDGIQGFANQIGNQLLVGYASLTAPMNIIGNQSNDDGVTWNPAASGSDPPSHYVLVVKDWVNDCTYYPVFDLFNNNLGMAWLENNPLGRLNLKYNELLLSGPGTGTASPSATATSNSTIYIYPNINTAESTQAQNVPLNDIFITDINNNTFNLDAFMATFHQNLRGYELSMPNSIKSIKFTQKFREPANIEGFVGSAVTESVPFSLPLPAINIAVYYGQSNQIYKQLVTDATGKFNIPVQARTYTFEIFITNPSINYSQRFI